MTAKAGTRKRAMNRAMRGQCLSMVVHQLAYKAESAGGQLVKVGPQYTTQTCSVCGRLADTPVGLSARVYRCAHCGYEANRKVNAARNIRARGLPLLGWQGMRPPCRPVAAQAAHGRPLGPAPAGPKPSCDTGTRGRALPPAQECHARTGRLRRPPPRGTSSNAARMLQKMSRAPARARDFPLTKTS